MEVVVVNDVTVVGVKRHSLNPQITCCILIITQYIGTSCKNFYSDRILTKISESYSAF